MGLDSVEQPGNIADHYVAADGILMTVVNVCTDINVH